MVKFLREVLILFVTILISFLLLVLICENVVGNQYEKEYNAAIIEKVGRLKSIDVPKIILVGNSNLAFGICSEMIEDEIGMPVINLGLHGSLGNAFLENMAIPYISQGDIVIICHTSYADDDTIPDNLLAWITLEHHKELYYIIRDKDKREWLLAYPRYAFNSLMLWMGHSGNKSSGNCYAREAFNKYGDNIFERDNGPFYNFGEHSITVPEVGEVCSIRINEYNDCVKQKGATLLVAGYPIAYGEYTPLAEEYEAFQMKLEEVLDCDVISDFTDYFIPYQYFYNSTLHLTNEGAKIRTEILISDLKRWLYR